MKKVLLSLINLFFLTTHGKQFKIYSFTLFIVSGSIFTTVPETQYVYVNDTVKFECRTSSTEYINSLMIDTNPPLGGVYPNKHHHGDVFITLTATSELNGTSFTCRALHDTTKPAYLYVQGQYNTFSFLKHKYLMGNNNFIFFISRSS